MAKEVTIPEMIAQLRSVTQRLEKPLREAVDATMFDVIGRYKRRLFLEGKTTSGSRIGSYSRKPTYVSIRGAKKKYGSQLKTSKLKPRGKNSDKVKFKNGKRRKSRYEKDGYAGFRETVGRQSSKIDLHLTGELERSILVGTNGNSAVMGFTRDKSFQLAKTLEKQLGKNIFSISEKETERALDRIEKELDIQLNKIFK